MADEALCRLVDLHLHIDLAPFLASTSGGKEAQGSKASGRGPSKGGKRGGGADADSLEEFVSRTLPLLDLEKDAEIAQVGSSSVSASKVHLPFPTLLGFRGEAHRLISKEFIRHAGVWGQDVLSCQLPIPLN